MSRSTVDIRSVEQLISPTSGLRFLYLVVSRAKRLLIRIRIRICIRVSYGNLMACACGGSDSSDSVKSPTDGEAMALFQGRKKEKKEND